jgi:hypothetical protein
MRLVLLTLLAVGCDGGGAGALSLALADPAFGALADGADVPLVVGAQGGMHVWMNVRVRGAVPDAAPIARAAHRVVDDALVLQAGGVVELVDDGAGERVSRAPLPLFMCPSPVGLSVVDTPIRFELRLESATRAITLVPRCPPDALELCLKICTG